MAYLCQCDFGFRGDLLSQTSTARQMKKSEEEKFKFCWKIEENHFTFM